MANPKMPRAVFLNGSSKGVLSDQSKTRERIISLVRDYNVEEIYVPVITLDGKASFKNAPDREQKYSGRDLLDEVRDAVVAAGKTVGKVSGSVRLSAWIEGPFSAYVTGAAQTPLEVTTPFASKLRYALLTSIDAPVNDPTGGTLLKDPYGAGNAYLDPLDTTLQSNLKNVIAAVSQKSYINAVILDDHFGIDTRTDIKRTVLKKHPVPADWAKGSTTVDTQTEKEDSWLRYHITKLILDIKAVLPSGIELWAATNRPNYAKYTQLQDAPGWAQQKIINRLCVQLYRRTSASFDSEWKLVETEASQISTLASREVYLSIALAAEADGAKVDPNEMARQISQITNLQGLTGVSKPVPAYVVAFDEQAWLPNVVR